jgi:hypothetical protein
LALIIFQVGSWRFCWGWPWNCAPPIYASCIARIICMYHHTQFICRGGILLMFSLGWLQTTVLLISTSW